MSTQRLLLDPIIPPHKIHFVLVRDGQVRDGQQLCNLNVILSVEFQEKIDDMINIKHFSKLYNDDWPVVLLY